MIDFARSKGWTDESGRIRAHIELDVEREEETHRD